MARSAVGEGVLRLAGLAEKTLFACNMVIVFGFMHMSVFCLGMHADMVVKFDWIH